MTEYHLRTSGTGYCEMGKYW